jgi:DNA-binding transcriptional MocR family regulator
MADDPLDFDTGLPPRVAADAAVLAPMALSVARLLPEWPDVNGIMRPDHRAVARELHTDVVTIVGALEQLVRRGHLIVEPREGERPGYRFAAAPMSRKPSPPRVVPFPRGRDRGFVERQAARMARLSRDAASRYLCHMLQGHAADLRARGIAEQLIEREIDTLSHAINGASFSAVLIPDDREPA